LGEVLENISIAAGCQFDTDEIKLVSENINKARIMQSELDYLRDQFWLVDSVELLRTKSNRMQKVFQQIRSVSPTKSTVLLIGETGTGKSVLAQLIHHHSNRKETQFISVHCSAMQDTLIESELFGHEKGAFTGAVRRKLGKFEIASGGTIFLDEIGTIAPAAQIKLLQVLQDGTYQRVGGEETSKMNGREDERCWSATGYFFQNMRLTRKSIIILTATKI